MFQQQALLSSTENNNQLSAQHDMKHNIFSKQSNSKRHSVPSDQQLSPTGDFSWFSLLLIHNKNSHDGYFQMQSFANIQLGHVKLTIGVIYMSILYIL